MPFFALTLDDDGQGEPKRIEFTADDPHRAFFILERFPFIRVHSRRI